MRYRAKVDIWVSIVTILTGFFFTYQVSQIETFSDDTIGPRFFPYALSFVTIGVGLFIGLTAAMSARAQSSDCGLTPDDSSSALDSFGFHDANVRRIVAVIAVGLVYITLFYSFGYLLATGLALFLMLLAFGNRGFIKLLVTSVAGALVYRYVIIGLLGVYSPPGKFFDLEEFLVTLL